MKLNVLKLGKCDYDESLNIQLHLLAKRQRGEIEDTLILVEHPPVITLGKNAEESHILSSERFLDEKGITVNKTARGGDVTYHGDGQIVGYPIFNIRENRLGIRKFVEGLENIFVGLLNDEFQIHAHRDEKHTGVWIDDAKIVAIGLAVKRGVTMHGFAFNVSTDLEHFKYIVPCGIFDRGVTSVEALTGEKPDFEKMNDLVLDYFCKEFNFDEIEEIYL